MANSTYFSTKIASPSGQLGNAIQAMAHQINFAEKNVTQNDTIDIFNVPAGTVIMGAALCCDSVITASTTLSLGDSAESGNDNIINDTAVGTTAGDILAVTWLYEVGTVTTTAALAPIFVNTADTLRCVVGGATAVTGKATFIRFYYTIPSQR